MPVGEMLARMSGQELTEWMAFYQLEPWGTKVDDQRAGIVASTMANLWGGGKKKFKPDDFMPEYRVERRKRTPDWKAMRSALMGRFGNHG